MDTQSDLERWNSVESGPFFTMDSSTAWSQRVLPEGYFHLALSQAGREGFIGQQYLRLYRLEELRALNEAYQTALYCPGLVVFASDGYGEGFAFLGANRRVLKVPLIPLPIEGEEIEVVAPDFQTFFEAEAKANVDLRPSASSIGFELHLKQPLCLGGDWKDENNQVMVTPFQHAELARYWNQIYRSLLKQSGE